MHSSERTLLASLGFADPDKKSSRHDLACQYLTLPEVSEKVRRAIDNRPETWIEEFHTEFHIQKGEGKYATTIGFADVMYRIVHRTKYELVPQNRDWYPDYYPRSEWIKSDIDRNTPVVWDEGTRQWGYWREAEAQAGWAAVLGENPKEWVKVEWPEEASRFPNHTWRWRLGIGFQHSLPYEIRETAYCLLVEVKTTPVPVGDIIRQLNLYRSYLTPSLGDPWGKTMVVATTFDITKDDGKVLKAANIVHLRLGAAFDHWAEQQESATSVADSLEI